jgi:hypothetical protein
VSSRREFLGTAISVAAADELEVTQESKAASWTPPYFPNLVRGQYDYDAMMAIMHKPGPAKQLFLCDPGLGNDGVAAIFEKAGNAWTDYEISLTMPPARKSLAIAIMLISRPIIFALNDTMWEKYRFGQVYGLRDRYGRPALENFALAPWSNLDPSAAPTDPHGIYHDFTIAALRKRGAGIMVCHNAIAGISAGFIKSSGFSHPTIVNEWTKNVVPGVVVVPSGALAVQLAQENGYHVYAVTD